MVSSHCFNDGIDPYMPVSSIPTSLSFKKVFVLVNNSYMYAFLKVAALIWHAIANINALIHLACYSDNLKLAGSYLHV